MGKTNLHLRVYTTSVDVNDRAADDQIYGEVTQIYHEGEIQLESWNWSHSRTDGSQAKKTAVPTTLKFSKRMDAASVPLLGYLKSGVPLSLVVVNMIDDPQESPFGLTAQFFDVLVKSYSLTAQGQGASGELMENWEIDYRRAKFGYWLQYAGQFQAAGEASFEVTRKWGDDEAKDQDKSKTPAGGEGQGDAHGDQWALGDHNSKGEGIAQPRSKGERR